MRPKHKTGRLEMGRSVFCSERGGGGTHPPPLESGSKVLATEGRCAVVKPICGALQSPNPQPLSEAVV